MKANSFRRRPKKRRESRRASMAPNRKVEPRRATEEAGAGTQKLRSIASGTGRVLLALVLTAGVVFFSVAAYRHARTSEYFRVTHMDVRGNQKLERDELLSFAGLDGPTNIFRVEVTRLAQKLTAHDWIAKATVRRSLPRRLVIEIVEREAAALVMFDVPYIVDTSGEIFKRWTIEDPAPTPVITGMERDRIARDAAGVERRIRDALDLAQRYRAVGIEKSAPLHEIHCEAGGGFSLTAGGDPFYVEFGKGPYRVRLKRLATLLSRMKREGRRPLHIYFDNELRPSRITVKLKQSDSEKMGSGDALGDEKRVSKI